MTDLNAIDRIAEDIAGDLARRGLNGDQVMLVGFIVQQIGSGMSMDKVFEEKVKKP